MNRPKKSSGAKPGGAKKAKPAGRTEQRRPSKPRSATPGAETKTEPGAAGNRLYGARPAGGTGRDGVGRDAIGFGRTAAGPAGKAASTPVPKRTKAKLTRSAPRNPAAAQATGQTAPIRGRRSSAREAPQLDAPAPDTAFKDRDGEVHRFPDSSLKRVAARLLGAHRKVWRYRPFAFPIFMPSGQEQTLNFDFVVYDNQDAVIRVILVAARDSAEVWDKIGRFKKQYPMYTHEIWTPERLAELSRPRAQLGF